MINASEWIDDFFITDSINLPYLLFMDHTNQKAWVLNAYGEKMEYKEFPLPELVDGEFLIKVEASTINPSDR